MQQYRDLKLSPYNVLLKENIDKTVIEFDKKQINIQFTIEKEMTPLISWISQYVERKQSQNSQYTENTHRQTDIVIRNDSSHPHEE
jgi:RIO-like serine/threonine protein kinase